MKKLKSQLINAISSALIELKYPEKKLKLSRPINREYGDISCNIALLLAGDLKKNPMNIGEEILSLLGKMNILNVQNISIAKPGFINFKITNIFFQSYLGEIIIKNKDYGKGSLGKNKTANVEFVSANPTGPLTVGHGRNAIIGDIVSNILEWQDYQVTKEYYYNDAGRQMRKLGESVRARYLELQGEDFEFPEDGYSGEYIVEIAQKIKSSLPKNFSLDHSFFSKKAEKIIFSRIKSTLSNLGIYFDKYTNEKIFYKNKDIDKLISSLREKNLIYEKDGATWFKASSLGNYKDRVYIKGSGEPTYRVPDTAYHSDKIKRGYDLIIDVFGADHADSHIDVRVALNALGFSTEHIKVLLYQFVTLVKDGKKIKMSTRKANFITLDELISNLGPDVVRYFFIMRNMNSHLEFDLTLASNQSDKNPIHYIKYAHARICNVLVRYKPDAVSESTTQWNLLKTSYELNLIKHLISFPENIDSAYKSLEPQLIGKYLKDLASMFHSFYNNCRVLTSDKKLSHSRIKLLESTKIVLRNGLSILGIEAPEKM